MNIKKVDDKPMVIHTKEKSALETAVGRLSGRITDVAELAAEEENTQDIIEADPDVKNYTYTFVDGKLYYRENSVMYRKELSATAEERIKGILHFLFWRKVGINIMKPIRF